MKTWKIEYDHKDGRKGTVIATTEIVKSDGFQYGNGKAGRLTVGSSTEQVYDLRYCTGDLHRVMIDDYFGKGIVSVTEL